MKKIVIIGAGPLQIPLIRKAKELNLYTIAVDRNDQAVGRAEVDEFHPFDTNDLERILTLSREHRVNGIITNSDYPVRVASAVAKALGLNGIEPVAALVATDKLLLREVLRASGIRSLQFAKIERKAQITHHLDVIDYPFILKPVDSSASRGVSLITQRSEIEEAYERAFVNSKNGTLIMEQYISGREFSVETFTNRGVTRIIAVTEKMTSGPPYFVETGHIIPAQISTPEYEAIVALVTHVLSAIGIDNGPAHTELKINEDGIHIIEVGPRLGGDYISTDLVPLATGYDLVGNTVRLAASIPLSDTAVVGKRAAGIMFFSSQPGIVKRIEGDLLSGIDNLVRLELGVKVGDRVGLLNSSMARAGHAVVTGASFIEVMQALQQVKSQINIVTAG